MVTVSNTAHHPADRAPTLHSTHDAVSAALSQTPTPYLRLRLPWYKQTSYCITLPNKRRQKPFRTQNLVTYCFHRWYVQVKAAFGKTAGNTGQAQPAHLATREGPQCHQNLQSVFLNRANALGHWHFARSCTKFNSFFLAMQDSVAAFPVLRQENWGLRFPKSTSCTCSGKKPRKREEQLSSNRSWHKRLQSFQLLHLLL